MMTKEEFKQIRLDLKLTQEQLAEQLGMSRRAIIYLESGEMEINRRTEMAIKYFASR